MSMPGRVCYTLVLCSGLEVSHFEVEITTGIKLAQNLGVLSPSLRRLCGGHFNHALSSGICRAQVGAWPRVLFVFQKPLFWLGYLKQLQ